MGILVSWLADGIVCRLELGSFFVATEVAMQKQGGQEIR